MDARKQQIQQRFFIEAGLRIDFPKPGFGSSNDGNTARRFFNNISQSAEITGEFTVKYYIKTKILTQFWFKLFIILGTYSQKYVHVSSTKLIFM